MSEKPLIIGVAGGSGSGKTTVVDKILQRIGKSNIQLIEHDSYYRDLKHLPFSEREKENFDHPSALETELMIHHLEALRRGEEVQRSEEHTSELQSRGHIVCRLLLEKQKKCRQRKDCIFIDGMMYIGKEI